MPTEKKDPMATLIAQDDLRGNKEAIADLKDTLKGMASTHAAAVQTKKRDDELPGVHLIPVEGMTEADAWDGAKWFEKKREDDERRRAEQEADDNKTYLYYLKCRDTPTHMIGGRKAPPHGIYFTKKPNGTVIHQGEWFSDYKKDPNAVWRQEIHCQACLKMGINGSRLPYEWHDPNLGSFIVDPRWVWKTPKDYKRWLIEGDTRVWDMRYDASNTWRAEVEAKIAKARQEGVLTNG